MYVTYAQAGYVSHDLEAEGFPCSVRFANFANTLSVGTSTGVVQLWDVKTRKVKKTFQVWILHWRLESVYRTLIVCYVHMASSTLGGTIGKSGSIIHNSLPSSCFNKAEIHGISWA